MASLVKAAESTISARHRPFPPLRPLFCRLSCGLSKKPKSGARGRRPCKPCMSRNFGGKALIIGGDTGMNRVNTTLPKRPYDSVAVGQDGPGFGCGDGGQTNPTVRLLVPAITCSAKKVSPIFRLRCHTCQVLECSRLWSLRLGIPPTQHGLPCLFSLHKIHPDLAGLPPHNLPQENTLSKLCKYRCMSMGGRGR